LAQAVDERIGFRLPPRYVRLSGEIVVRPCWMD
jgi:hypothetical protein